MQDDQGPNMELRAFIAVVLSLAVMVVYQYFFAPPPPDPASMPLDAPVAEGAAPAPSEIPGSGNEVGLDAADPTNTDALSAGAVVAAAEQTTTLETSRYVMQVTNRGARITSMVLKDFESDFGAPLDLVVADMEPTLGAMLALLSPDDPGYAAPANDALFAVTVDGSEARRRYNVEQPLEVRWTWSDGAGWSVDKRLQLDPDGYVIGLRISARGPGGAPLFVTLGPGLEADADTARVGVYLVAGAITFDGSSIEHLAIGDLETPQVGLHSLVWGGIQSNYFAALFVPEAPTNVYMDAAPEPPATTPDSAPVGAEGDPQATDAAAGPGTRARFGVQLPSSGDALQLPVYMGPKSYDILVAEGYGLERAVDYGIFRILARPVALTLEALYDVTGNYGLAIILATLGVRILFFPLSQSSMKSMRKMQSLQPQMNAIRARYKGVKDMQKRQDMNAEVMALYKQHGVSPLGGCLPMLLQMPVLFGFYAAISVSIDIRQAPFALWIQDLSQMDPYYVLPLLMGASMYAQQRMSPAAGDPMQQRIFRLMPIMFTFFFLTFPSGLVIYWLVNTVLGIAQQAYVNHQIGPVEAKPAAAGKKPKQGKPRKGGGAKRKKRGKR